MMVNAPMAGISRAFAASGVLQFSAPSQWLPKAWIRPGDRRLVVAGSMLSGQQRQLSSSSAEMEVFSRQTKQQQKVRAWKAWKAQGGSPASDAFRLRAEVAERLLDRLDDTLRKFPEAIDIGSSVQPLLSQINGRGGIKKLVQADCIPELHNNFSTGEHDGIVAETHAFEGESLGLGEAKYDLAMSNLWLHWINDVPGVMHQIKQSLRPDGLFLASIFGGDSLFELRQAFILAELEREGGVGPHVSPMVQVSDAGSLLGRTGFKLTAVDVDTLKIYYPSALHAMHALQAMGEGNAIIERRFMKKETMMAAAAVYEGLHRDEDGVPLTFQILYLSGWAPAEGQQQPKERGSAQVSLEELGAISEIRVDGSTKTKDD